MDDRSFRQRLRSEVAGWIDEGIITPEQGEAITAAPLRTREAAPAAPAKGSRRDAPSWSSIFLYLAAGILIGAAAITFVIVGLDPEDPHVPLFIAGAALLAAGGAARVSMPAASLLQEAILVAALVPITVSAADPPEAQQWVGPVAMVAAAGLLLWRHERPFMRPLPVIAFSVSSGFTFFEIFDASQAGPWLLVQGLLLAALVALPKVLHHRPSGLATATGVLAAAIAFIFFGVETLDIESSQVMEALVGVFAATLLGLGLGLRDRGLAFGAIVVGCIDAIVFAFDVGGAILGTVVLVALAIALIVQAEMLKRLWGQHRPA